MKIGSRKDTRIWEHPTGLAYRNGVGIYYGMKGSSDIVGITKGGRFLAIEVKTGSGDLHGDQPAFKAMVESLGGVYVLARSVQDVTAILDSIR